MPYILNKTNGAKLAVLEDASLDLTTNLTFIGRNYSGYGEIFNENFIKLLENFANTTKPSRPIIGQLWFDSNADNKRLNLCFDGTNFKPLANISVQETSPDIPSSVKGDLWWDTTDNQLKAYNGSSYVTVGPVSSSASRSSWKYDEEIGQGDPTNTEYPILKALVGTDPIVAIAKLASGVSSMTPKIDSDLNADFSNGVKKGITLAGADASGSSKSAGYYFWGTASDALRSTTATNVTVTANNSGTGPYYVPFVSSATGDVGLKTDTAFSYDATANVLTTTAAAARYADLAERYHADQNYSEGTVVVIGGEKEVTQSTVTGDVKVVGVVSKKPALMMNSDAGPDETHPYIALKGRVPCKVYGRINKGDLLISSSIPGHACSATQEFTHPCAILGKALQENIGGQGVIEILVV